jgi:hypothetical protein
MNLKSARGRAFTSGKKYFSTNEPCCNGHIGLRRVDNDSCLKCTEESRIARDALPQVRHKKRKQAALKKYDLAPDQFDAMLVKQHGRCAICLLPFGYNREDYSYPCVDHDHFTGKVRGLLCAPCNRGIGMFRDEIDVMCSAIEYLIEHRDYSRRNSRQ